MFGIRSEVAYAWTNQQKNGHLLFKAAVVIDANHGESAV